LASCAWGCGFLRGAQSSVSWGLGRRRLV
jgi:hypothetical protein